MQKFTKYDLKYTKNIFLFAEHTLSEDIILNEVSLGGSPTICFALNINCNISGLGADNKNVKAVLLYFGVLPATFLEQFVCIYVFLLIQICFGLQSLSSLLLISSFF